MTFLELFYFLFSNVFEVFDVEHQTNSQLKLDFGFGVFEGLLFDGWNVDVVRHDSFNEEFVVLLRPIKSFFGVEVSVVEGVVLVAYLRTRQGSSHELGVTLVIDLRVFDHL